jgi:hypothetical protein
VKVIVGKDSEKQQTFFVHEGLICARSKFFHKALNGNWTESSERLVKLPDDKPVIFELYLQLLYTNNLPIGVTEDGKQFSELARLYVLAEKVMDTKSKNIIVAAMISRGADGYFATGNAIKWIYEGTVASSPARRLYVDLYAFYAPKEDVENPARDWPIDFWMELSRALILRRDIAKDDLKEPHETPENYMEEEEQEVG